MIQTLYLGDAEYVYLASDGTTTTGGAPNENDLIAVRAGLLNVVCQKDDEILSLCEDGTWQKVAVDAEVTTRTDWN